MAADSRRLEPPADSTKLPVPIGAGPAPAVGIVQEAEGLDQMPEAVDPGGVEIVARDALDFRQVGAGDGERLGLEGQFVRRVVSDDDEPRLARELARLEGA